MKTIILSEDQLAFVRHLVEDASTSIEELLQSNRLVSNLVTKPILEALDEATTPAEDVYIFTEDHLKNLKAEFAESHPNVCKETEENSQSGDSLHNAIAKAVIETNFEQSVIDGALAETVVEEPEIAQDVRESHPGTEFDNSVEWVKAAQPASGLTNIEFADFVGIGKSSLGFWKQGKHIPGNWGGIIALVSEHFGWPVPTVARKREGEDPIDEPVIVDHEFEPHKPVEPTVSDLDEIFKIDWKFVPPAEGEKCIEVSKQGVVQVIRAAAKGFNVEGIYERSPSLGDPKSIASIQKAFDGLVQIMVNVEMAGFAPFKVNEAVEKLQEILGEYFGGKTYLSIPKVEA